MFFEAIERRQQKSTWKAVRKRLDYLKNYRKTTEKQFENSCGTVEKQQKNSRKTVKISRENPVNSTKTAGELRKNFVNMNSNSLTLQDLQRLKEERLEATLPAVLDYLEGVRPSDQLQEAVQLFFEAKGYKLTEEDGLRLLVLTAEDKDSAVSLPAFTPEGLKAHEAALDALKSLLPGLITDLTFEDYLERYEKHFGEVQVKAALLDFSGQLELRSHGS